MLCSYNSRCTKQRDLNPWPVGMPTDWQKQGHCMLCLELMGMQLGLCSSHALTVNVCTGAGEASSQQNDYVKLYPGPLKQSLDRGSMWALSLEQFPHGSVMGQ